MIIFGRSIGTGPASTFTKMFKPRACILMSAYTSIKSVAANVAGRFLSNFIQAHFNNLETMKQVNSPIIFIHGNKDDLILSEHSVTLFKTLQKQKEGNKDRNDLAFVDLCRIVLHDHMTHNDFHLKDDILEPIK